MLEKNLSKISIYKIPSPYIQPLPGIVGDSHSKSPLHILTTRISFVSKFTRIIYNYIYPEKKKDVRKKSF